MSCQGKKIVVTGGGTGYGYGTARMLAKAGADVTITGRREQVLKKAADELGVKYIVADITKGEDWDAVFASVGDRLDVLINNAGAAVKIAPLAELNDEQIAAALNINLLGASLGCRRAAKVMASQKSGLIINVSSLCADYGWPGFTPYSAAKAGLEMLTRTLYTELRPSGVRVTLVTPSWGDTEFVVASNRPPHDPEKAKRMMSPDEMGELMVFLCGFHEHLEFSEIKVQPLIQEIIPF